MQRLELAQAGELTELLTLTTFDPPTPGPEQVLVALEAATVNSSDFLHISGRYFVPAKPGAPVGAEGVGRVVSVGPGSMSRCAGTAWCCCRLMGTEPGPLTPWRQPPTSLPYRRASMSSSWPWWASTR